MLGNCDIIDTMVYLPHILHYPGTFQAYAASKSARIRKKASNCVQLLSPVMRFWTLLESLGWCTWPILGVKDHLYKTQEVGDVQLQNCPCVCIFFHGDASFWHLPSGTSLPPSSIWVWHRRSVPAQESVPLHSMAWIGQLEPYGDGLPAALVWGNTMF